MNRSSDDAVAEQLGRVYLFSELGKRQLHRLVGKGKVVEHPTGTEVVSEGDTAFGFHLLLEGEAVVEVHGEARRTLHSGDYFGEIALIDGKPRSATVRTTTPVQAWAISRWNFTALLKDDNELAHGLLLGLCARLREVEARPAQH